MPTLVEQLGLGAGRMGTVLLLTGLGSIMVMPIVGKLCDRCSNCSVLSVCAPAAALCLLTPAAARGYSDLLAAGLLVGAGLGALDVSMNAQAVLVERAAGRPLMSGFHGVWSLGAVAGGAAVAAGLGSGIGLRMLLCVAGPLCAVLFTGPLLLTRVPVGGAAVEATPPNHADHHPLPGQLVTLLGLLAMAGFVCEGVGYSWAVLHATRDVHAPPATASLVYTAFVAALTCSRLVGDRVRAGLGARRGIALAGTTAGMGYFLVLMAPSLPTWGLVAEFAGWTVVGLGLATVVPTLISTAGSGTGEVGRALSQVTTLAYVGSLAGPALVGLVADQSSLTAALVLPAVLALAISVLGPPVMRRVSAVIKSADAIPPVDTVAP